MILDDLNKIFLYQKLNLGYECSVCKSKFFNRLDHLAHIIQCKKEKLKCDKCGKMFGNLQILQLHLRFHDASQTADKTLDIAGSVTSSGVKSTNCCQQQSLDLAREIISARHRINELTKIPPENDGNEILTDNEKEIETQKTNKMAESETVEIPPVYTPRKKRKTVPKKKVGLTKIRMEDCLRCDECSCIYIDSRDYYKHMRNFHKIDLINNVLIEPPASKKRCRSCCKQCRGQNCSSPKRPRASRPGSNLIFKINVRDNFKDRLTRALSQPTPASETQVSSLLEADVKPDLDAIAIKPDPDVDLTHLLSQVEVKIKTEPDDNYD